MQPFSNDFPVELLYSHILKKDGHEGLQQNLDYQWHQENENTPDIHYKYLDISFGVLTSFSRQFPPNVSTSMYKRGAVPNISWSKNVVILA